jgi:hypothetical protein
MVALHYGSAAIAVAKPGDECWTQLGPVENLKSAMSFARRFYCVTFKNLLVLETAMANRPLQLVVALDSSWCWKRPWRTARCSW